VLLEPMMPAAQGPKVAPARRATAIMRPGVVKIATPGGLAAAPEPASEIAGGHKFHEARWRPVRGRRLNVSAVTHSSIGGSHTRGAGCCPTGSAQGSYQYRAKDRVLDGVSPHLTGRGQAEQITGHDQCDTTDQPHAAGRRNDAGRVTP
jgi:hypothetical protein